MSKFLINTAMILFVYCTMLVGIAEFMVGCGTTAYYPDGTWETRECLVIPYETKQGEW